MELFPGRELTTVSGKTLTVLSLIASGGQGAVYKCEWGGVICALKWYHKNALKGGDALLNNLKNNIENGPPAASFLWAMDITNDYDGVFGYIMPLIPPDFRAFSDFLLAKTRFHSLTAMVDACLNIIAGFRALHKKGYSYQDINDGNFFINPETGEVLICDNDNIAPYGENLGIAGKCRYMAPEVVLGEKLPDVQTDKFSLSVILFLIMFMNHPLEGKGTMPPCMTEALEKKYYAEKPIFIYDEEDHSNRPVRGVHVNVLARWDIFPAFLKKAFVYAFSNPVLKGGEPRIIEKEWQQIFETLKTAIIPCGSCGGETFYDTKSGDNKCINCETPINLPAILKTASAEIPVIPGKYIYEYEIDPDSEDFTRAVGFITKGAKNPNAWGLRNLTGEFWNVTDTDGTATTRGTNEVTRVKPGVKIDFGGNSGEFLKTEESV
jgi:DNA-binding helix-hairpin-helix protein with protein kinase domain